MKRLQLNEVVNGYKIEELNGGHFIARNDDYSIMFIAEGRNGGLYTSVKSYTNKRNNRTYQAGRFTFKFISTVCGISATLAEMDVLWDYKLQKPFLEAKVEAMRKTDANRAKEGKEPLYSEYLNKFN